MEKFFSARRPKVFPGLQGLVDPEASHQWSCFEFQVQLMLASPPAVHEKILQQPVDVHGFPICSTWFRRIIMLPAVI